MFGAAQFAAMKPSAYFINTARGGIHDEAALVAALRAGRSPAPGSTCSCRSRREPDHPLLQLDNVIASPHIAGMTVETMNEMCEATALQWLDHLRWRRAAAAGEPRGVAALLRAVRRAARLPSGGPAMSREGLLLAMMEPPPAMEEEFQDWYDTEHFPERADLRGLPHRASLRLRRRLAALSRAVRPGGHRRAARTGLRAIAASATRRGRTGSCRACGASIAPTRRRSTPATRCSATTVRRRGCVMWRFRQAPATRGTADPGGTADAVRGSSQVAQARLFRADQPDGTDYIAIVELRAPQGGRTAPPRRLATQRDTSTCSTSTSPTRGGWRARSPRADEQPPAH